jgi:hypothetical protein
MIHNIIFSMQPSTTSCGVRASDDARIKVVSSYNWMENLMFTSDKAEGSDHSN